jgi:tRNA-dihydrouridine synthase B
MSDAVKVQKFQNQLKVNMLILAPMAGVSDLAMRSLCIEQGANLTYTEMISSMALNYESKKSIDLLRMAPNEEVVVVQLFGHDPKVMAKQAAFVENFLGEKLICIDINMGCPVRKIVSKGDGSALMQTPELASKIVREVVGAVSVPVSVKFRRGFEMGKETAPEFAKLMQESGVACVAIHGRYSKQLYSGTSDNNVIAKVKQVLDIPVIGNGDITSADSALAMKRETKCDSLMIGRAAQGNPWIFSQIAKAFNGKDYSWKPSAMHRIEMARRHAYILSKTEKYSIVSMRKHAMCYVFGLPGASKAREAFNACVYYEDFCDVFSSLEEKYKENDYVS